jgi:hypothetical protein
LQVHGLREPPLLTPKELPVPYGVTGEAMS